MTWEAKMKKPRDIKDEISLLQLQLKNIEQAQDAYREREGILRNELQNLYNELDKMGKIS